MIRTARTAALAGLALLAAGCPTKKDSEPNVHDDVWVATGAGPARILLDGDAAWVVNYVANSVDVIDLTTCGTSEGSCDLLGTVNLPEGSGPFDGVIAGGRAQVVLSNVGQVASIDTGTRTVVATISTGAAALLSPQAVAVGNGDLFIADSNFYGSGPGFLALVEGSAVTATLATTQLQPIGFTNLANGDLAVTNLGYVDFGQSPAVATSAGGIDIVDPVSGTVTDNVDLGLTAPVCRIAVHGDYGYTASSTEGTLLRVTLSTGLVEEFEVTSSGSFLTWTQVEGDRLYVLSSDEDRIYVYDAATTELVDEIEVGPGGDTPKGPSHAAVWEDADGVKHLFVVMALSNSVTDVVLE